MVIALLGSCTTENDARVATREHWEEALKEDHLRVKFTKPCLFSLTGDEQDSVIEEIVVPISASSAPNHLYIRTGEKYRAFAKYDFKTCAFLQEKLKELQAARK
jgi:hypothetical protein